MKNNSLILKGLLVLSLATTSILASESNDGEDDAYIAKCPVSQRYTSFQKVISLNILGKILNISGLILNQLSTASNGVLTFNSFLKLPCLLLKL